MKTLQNTLFCLVILCCVNAGLVQAQTDSPHKVKYLVTHDQAADLFTAWVVPQYSTPNFNNPDSEEKGATAQFSLQVPPGFVMQEFRSITGNWDGYNTKIGRETYFKEAGLNTGLEYYILGKAPAETNYGVFTAGEPVALFSFKGTTPNPELVAVVENQDPFVDIAYNKLSLNVAASFYSKSGQKPGPDARPLEQFLSKTDLREVLQEAAEKLGATEALLIEETDASKSVLVYPNPTDTMVSVKYFSLQEDADAKVELFDQNGAVLQTQELKAKRGFNTTELNLSELSANTYLIRTEVAGNAITKKVVKQN